MELFKNSNKIARYTRVWGSKHPPQVGMNRDGTASVLLGTTSKKEPQHYHLRLHLEDAYELYDQLASALPPRPSKKSASLVSPSQPKQSVLSKHIHCYTQADLDAMSVNREQAGLTHPGWYFWDETEAYAHGPFSTEQEALRALNHYATSLNQTQSEPLTLEQFANTPQDRANADSWDKVGSKPDTHNEAGERLDGDTEPNDEEVP